jgi:cell division protein ZapA
MSEMPELSVVVNGHTYAIMCGEGQEDHVSALADDLDRRVSELVSVIGQAGEARLLLMAGLLISDELAETRDRLAAGQQSSPAGEEFHGVETPQSAAVNGGQSGESVNDVLNVVFGDIDDLAQRIESVAQRLRCL